MKCADLVGSFTPEIRPCVWEPWLLRYDWNVRSRVEPEMGNARVRREDLISW